MSEEGYSAQPALAFDTDDPEFVRGVEIGVLWVGLLAADDDAEVEQTMHTSNAEMAIRMAEALGRRTRIEFDDGHWMHVVFEAKE